MMHLPEQRVREAGRGVIKLRNGFLFFNILAGKTTGEAELNERVE